MAKIIVNGVTLNVDEGASVTVDPNGSVIVSSGSSAAVSPVDEGDSSVDKDALFNDSIVGKYDVTFRYKSKSGRASTVSGSVYPADVEYLDDGDRLVHVETDDGWRSFLESGVQGDLIAFDRAGGEQKLVNTESVRQIAPGDLLRSLEDAKDHSYLSESKQPVKVKRFTYRSRDGIEREYLDYEFYPENFFRSSVDDEPSIRAEKDGEWKSFRRDRFTDYIDVVD